VKPPVEILSGDREHLQPYRDRDVIVLYDGEGWGWRWSDDDEVARRYSIPGRAYADFRESCGATLRTPPRRRGVGPRRRLT